MALSDPPWKTSSAGSRKKRDGIEHVADDGANGVVLEVVGGGTAEAAAVTNRGLVHPSARVPPQQGFHRGNGVVAGRASAQAS